MFVTLIVFFLLAWMRFGHSKVLGEDAWFQTAFVKVCCSTSDAFLADTFEEVDGKFYAILNDGYDYYENRQVFDPKIKILVPKEILDKAKDAPKNPTGHGIIFMSQSDYDASPVVHCYFFPSLS